MDMYQDKEFGEYCDKARMDIGSTYGLVAGDAWKASRYAIVIEMPTTCASDDPYQIKHEIMTELHENGIRTK